ncbi:TRAP transporter small permease [Chthonobacter rhizosphaerae]|uniref:TRAP transporter small permease n=1 Tax=Chthonobacter rhizosphaerae TaxID=2735553 RepID=UPI0015EF01C9|nr:TRAP transporter small permease [Chthonobacter rhizosphaerae]
MTAPAKPPTAFRAVSRVLDVLSTAALWLAAIGLVAMTLIVGWQVFGRYVLNSTPIWSEPLTLQLMSWFIVFGAAVGVRENFHLGLDLLHYLLPDAVGKVFDAITLVLMIVFGVAMSFYSAQLAIGTWSATLPALGWPGSFDFLPMVIGGALITLFSLERLVELAAGARHAPETQDVANIEVV